MQTFKIVFNEFTDGLKSEDKDRFEAVCDELEKKGLSIIIGAASRQESIALKGIATADGRPGIVMMKIYVLTISIGVKNVLQHEEYADDQEKMVKYMEEFLSNYNIKVSAT